MTYISRERWAARVILLDELGRILLVKGHDADNPTRQWWFTIGGGIELGESSRAAASRELFEETGVRVHEQELQGPVIQRMAIFDFAAEHVAQHEEFYVARVDSKTPLSREGWTELERSFVDDLAWLTVQELRDAKIEVFPSELANIVANLAAGWDGTVTTLGADLTAPHIAH